MKDITVKQAMDRLKKALQEDDDYYFGWQSNIAMSFYDQLFIYLRKIFLLYRKNGGQ